jgi:hypothetical protein
MSRLLLKARPTATQLADRLRDPRPDGLELYLDSADLADEAAMDAAVANVESLGLPSDFVLLIEGPVRSLDGGFFDLARDAEADRELIRRLGRLAGRLRAEAVNIHLIAPTSQPWELTQGARRAGLERGLELVRFFVEVVSAAGAVPTIENMPPVLRMRESGFYYSPIGMPAEDLVWLCEQAPGLRSTLDLSHAGLYANCRRYAANHDGPPPEGACPELLAFVRTFAPVDDVAAYAAALGSTLVTCHVANATGLLGEGVAYEAGDLALDQLIAALASRVRYFVTETLEADPDRAIEMRRALAAMRRALQAAACG